MQHVSVAQDRTVQSWKEFDISSNKVRSQKLSRESPYRTGNAFIPYLVAENSRIMGDAESLLVFVN